MSEPLAERLSRFTPDTSGFDRDGLLFAAGRASARPSHFWQWMAVLLMASQLCTLAILCWPKPAIPEKVAMPVIPAEPPVYFSPADPMGLAALNRHMFDADTTAAPVANLVAPEPPLRAFTNSSALSVD